MEKNYEYWETHKKILAKELAALDDLQCFFFMKDPNNELGSKISKTVDSKVKKFFTEH